MNQGEIDQVLQGLPPWLQVVALVVLAVAALVFGKRFTGSKRTNRNSGQATLRHTRISRWRELPDVHTLEESPGQHGPDATRDLSREELRGLQPSYDPNLDRDPDPGEVVWTWVPFVEHDGRGKDRPVLIIARLSDYAVAGCYLSTKQHRGFLPVGTGPWDGQGRPSYLNPNRVLRITHGGLRREGAVMPRERFEEIVAHVQHVNGNKSG